MSQNPQRAFIPSTALYLMCGVAVFAILEQVFRFTPPAGQIQPPGPEWFGAQRKLYDYHFISISLHVFSALLFVLIASLQFSENFRKRHINLHRTLGKIYLLITPVLGVSGVYLGVVLPFGGALETLEAFVLFALLLFASWKAYSSIQNRKISLHREWMIRLFAWTTSIATMRIVLGAFYSLQPFSDRLWFGITLWLGLAINALLAEIWISKTRKANA